MTQGRKSNGQFGKKVKASPLPSRDRKIMAQVRRNHMLTVEYSLELAGFIKRILHRLEVLEAGIYPNPKSRKRPQ